MPQCPNAKGTKPKPEPCTHVATHLQRSDLHSPELELARPRNPATHPIEGLVRVRVRVRIRVRVGVRIRVRVRVRVRVWVRV